MKIITSIPLRSGLAVLLSCLILPQAQAATEFEEDVPIEIVRHFLGTLPGGEEPRLYQDIMEAFPDFTVPDDVEVLASLDRGYQLSVLLRSQAEPDTALAALREQFEAQDWVVNSSPDRFAEQRGFIAPMPVVTSESLCHPEQGNLQISVREQMLTLTMSQQSAFADPVDCDRNNAISALQAARNRSGLGQHMPRLEIPNQPMTTGMFAGGGMSSSGNREAEARGNMQDDRSLGEIFDLFRTQLEEQGWTLEAENISESTATGTWIRSVDDIDLIGTLIGTLHITRLGEDSHDLRFRMVRQGGAGNAGGAFIRAAP